MLHDAIDLLEKEIRRIDSLVEDLLGSKLFNRASYRAHEVDRFKRILDLLKIENDKELDQ
jgi:hypothetical protein